MTIFVRSAAIAAGFVFLGSIASPAPAAVMPDAAALQRGAQSESLIEQIVVVRRARAMVGPRGGAAVRRSTVVRPGVRPVPVRPGVRPAAWVRPAHYWWRPGAAVAAGAAIGFVGAATAASWAGAAPGPGYCWYYTDPSRTQGFWDRCP
jgi:hypothetical protein